MRPQSGRTHIQLIQLDKNAKNHFARWAHGEAGTPTVRQRTKNAGVPVKFER
jgi:hypothetical protein